MPANDRYRRLATPLHAVACRSGKCPRHFTLANTSSMVPSLEHSLALHKSALHPPTDILLGMAQRDCWRSHY